MLKQCYIWNMTSINISEKNHKGHHYSIERGYIETVSESNLHQY